MRGFLITLPLSPVASVWEEAPSWGVALTVRSDAHELHSFYLEVTRESTQLEWLRYVEAAVRYRQLKLAFVSPSSIVISDLVGQGAYGSVYRGSFNGAVVAVKRLKVDSRESGIVAACMHAAFDLHDSPSLDRADIVLTWTREAAANMLQLPTTCSEHVPLVLAACTIDTCDVRLAVRRGSGGQD